MFVLQYFVLCKNFGKLMFFVIRKLPKITVSDDSVNIVQLKYVKYLFIKDVSKIIFTSLNTILEIIVAKTLPRHVCCLLVIRTHMLCNIHLCF